MSSITSKFNMNNKLLMAIFLLFGVGVSIDVFDDELQFKLSQFLYGGNLETLKGISINQSYFVEDGPEHRGGFPLLERNMQHISNIHIWFDGFKNEQVVLNAYKEGFEALNHPSCTLFTLAETKRLNYPIDGMVYFRVPKLLVTVSNKEGHELSIEDLRFVCDNMLTN